jgi:hypothetical protein
MRKYRKLLPTREQLANTKSLKFIEHLIFEPNLWHFNRHSVSFAFLVGSFCCFLPMPFQMVPCALLCFWIRCNVPLAIALVWVSNPITMPAMFYFAYRLGLWMLSQPDSITNIEFTAESITGQLGLIWQPLLLGSITCGLTFGTLGFVGVRVYWRWKVTREWNQRRAKQKLARKIALGG